MSAKPIDPTVRYPRTPHLEGSCLQVGDGKARLALKKLSGAFGVWEEKLDAANSAIRFDAGGRLVLQSRGHVLSGGGGEAQFGPFKAWAAAHRDELWALLGERYMLFGEQMYALHSSYYDQLEHYFYEFDTLDRTTGAFLSTADRHDLLMGASFPSVPLLGAGPMPSRPAQIEALIAPSLFKSERWREALIEAAQKAGERDIPELLKKIDDTRLSEGVYAKFETPKATIGRAKFVRSGFVQSMLSHDEHWSERALVPNGLSEAGRAQIHSFDPHPSRSACPWSPADLRQLAAQASFVSEADFKALADQVAKEKSAKKSAARQAR